MILGSLTFGKDFWILIQNLGYVMTLWPNAFLQSLWYILMILGSLDLIFYFYFFEWAQNLGYIMAFWIISSSSFWTCHFKNSFPFLFPFLILFSFKTFFVFKFHLKKKNYKRFSSLQKTFFFSWIYFFFWWTFSFRLNQTKIKHVHLGFPTN